MVKTVNTETKILEAARKVFMKKGLSGARMQEIADEAGINKALLHYYFRSKDQLFYAIFKEAFKILIPYVADIFNSGVTLEIKLTRLAEKYIEILEHNRYLPLFVLSEIQQNPDRVSQFLNLNEFVDFNKLSRQIISEFGIDTINEKMVRHIFVNFLANMIFPFIARPLIQFNMNLSDSEFHDFLQERKILIPKIFIATIKSMNEYATDKN